MTCMHSNKKGVIRLLIIVGLCLTVSSKLLSKQSNIPNLKEENSQYYDSPSTNLSIFFSLPKKEYHIRYNHTSLETINIPDSCVIFFEGGSIAAPIKFNNTRLSGVINLKGSNISGSVTNDVFDASWICNRDGKTDDANNINQIIAVSNNIFFPAGDYYLESTSKISADIPQVLQKQLKSHIGIHKSNLSLFGEKNTRFISSTPIVMVCVYSSPYQIDKSISNLTVDNITFIEKNDKENFHEFAHTIKLVGINNGIITNCRFEDFWGDAITLSHYGDSETTGERTRNQNIKIYNNYIRGGSHNNRNGISVISGENISIINNTIEQVSKKSMPGAIDIEANNSAYTIDNITIAYNTIKGCIGGVGSISIVSNRYNAPAHNIIIANNTITSSTYGISFVIQSDNCVSDISVVNNTIDGNTQPFKFVGSAKTNNWIVMDNKFSFDKSQFGGKIKISNLLVE